MKTTKEIVELVKDTHPPMLDEQELKSLEIILNLPGYPMPFHVMDQPLVDRLTKMIRALAAHIN